MLLVEQTRGVAALICTAILLVAGFQVARKRCLVLMRRARWLLLSIVLLAALLTPGEALFPAPAGFAPTLEGLAQGGEQALQLLCILAMVAILLELTPVEDIVGGIFALMAPLRAFPRLRERIALRLLLVLQYAGGRGSGTGMGGQGWREWLESAVPPPQSGTVVLQVTRYSTLDAAVALALVGALAFWISWG